MSDEFRVEALTPGCTFRYGGAEHEVHEVQAHPRTTYVLTDEILSEHTITCSDGSTVDVTSRRTFVFGTGTWVKGSVPA